MKFLVDHQLPPALARLISAELGFEAVHVQDLGMGRASDAEIWNYASSTQSVMVTKDVDFALISSRHPTCSLVWIRLGSCTRPALLAIFRQNWPRLRQQLERGERFIEIR